MYYEESKHDHLTDEEFGRMFGAQYLDYLETQEDADYQINRQQWFKLLHVLSCFDKLATKLGGSLDKCEIMPKEMHGGVTAYFPMFELSISEIVEFCEVLKLASAVTIDATTDGEVCISLSVPYVYVKKDD